MPFPPPLLPPTQFAHPPHPHLFPPTLLSLLCPFTGKPETFTKQLNITKASLSLRKKIPNHFFFLAAQEVICFYLFPLRKLSYCYNQFKICQESHVILICMWSRKSTSNTWLGCNQCLQFERLWIRTKYLLAALSRDLGDRMTPFFSSSFFFLKQATVSHGLPKEIAPLFCFPHQLIYHFACKQIQNVRARTHSLFSRNFFVADRNQLT